MAHKGVELECGYRVDIVLEGNVVVAIGCVIELLSVHDAQLLIHMRLGGFEIGLISFHVPVLKEGLRGKVL